MKNDTENINNVDDYFNKLLNKVSKAEVEKNTVHSLKSKTMAEKQKREIEQERAKKAKKAKGPENEITNLISFKKRHAYA